MKNLSVSSIIEKDSLIGEGTQIGYFTHILSGSKIGVSCSIGDRVHIGHDVHIGDKVEIGHGVHIFDGTIIEDNAKIGDGVSFGSTIARSKAPRPALEDKLRTIVEEWVIIGSNSTIVGNTKIKRGAVVGDGSVVLGTVFPDTFVAGNPARKIYSLSSFDYVRS